MSHEFDTDQLFRTSKANPSVPSQPKADPPQPVPKRIVVLLAPEGEVVARLHVLGQVAGEFRQGAGEKIFFRYRHGGGRRWYVNQDMPAFCEAAAIFNRYCELHAADEHTDDNEVWALCAAQLKSEWEEIEPLGDPLHSLWSATVHDTEGGLLNLG